MRRFFIVQSMIILLCLVGISSCSNGNDTQTKCETDEDCEASEICHAGFCTLECQTDSDCDEGWECLENFCYKKGSFQTCQDIESCPEGQHCQESDGTKDAVCVPDEIIDPCDPDPCKYGRQIPDTCEPTNDGGFSCECEEGYSGTLCNQCAVGYHPGETGGCEVNIPCDDEICGQRGQCYEPQGSATCACYEGYTGEFCDICAEGYFEKPEGSGICLLDRCRETPCLPPEIEEITIDKNPILRFEYEDFTVCAEVIEPDGDLVTFHWVMLNPTAIEEETPWFSSEDAACIQFINLNAMDIGVYTLKCIARDQDGDSEIAVLLINVSGSGGVDFYISNDGDDSFVGTSRTDQGNRKGPWRTLEWVSKLTFAPGDRIHLNKGDVWNESLTVTSSGEQDKPITFSSYGSGDDPIIDGENTRLFGVKLTGSHIHVTMLSFQNHKYQDKSEDDGAYCSAEFESGDILAMGQERFYDYLAGFCSSSIDSTEKVTDIELSYNTHLGSQAHAVHLMDASHANVNHNIITNITSANGIFLDNTSDTKITENFVSGAYLSGIKNSADDVDAYEIDEHTYGRTHSCDRNIIAANNITQSSKGIEVGGIFNFLQYNICFDNLQNNPDGESNAVGIHSLNSSDLVVRYNMTHGTQQNIASLGDGQGILIDQGSLGGLCFGNLIFENEGPGISVRNAQEAKIYNNTLYQNSKTGINNAYAGINIIQSVGFDASGEVFNNIVLDDNVAAVLYQGEPSPELSLHHNYYFNTTVLDDSTDQFDLDGTKKNFADWQTDIGDPDSAWADPKLTSPSEYQFMIMSESPCFDTGYQLSGVTLIGDYNMLFAPEPLVYPLDDYANEFLTFIVLEQDDGAWDIGAYVVR